MLTELRHAYRALLAAPALTAVAALTLALGIGATAATYSVVDAVLVRPLPYEAPERLAFVWEDGPGNDNGQASLRDVAGWRHDTRTFGALSAYRYWMFNMAGAPQAEGVLGGYVTDELFATLGARAALGRTFLPGEDRPGAERVVVLSDALWRRRFAADPHVVGRAIRMDGAAYTVVGVMGPSFEFPNTIPDNVTLPTRTLELWVPAGVDPLAESRGNQSWWVIGRLAPDATLARARSELAAFGRAQHAAHREANEVVSADELRAHIVRRVEPALLLFGAAVALVLLVACANVAGLLLARGSTRGREFGVRVALGATAGRLARQLLAESLLLAAVAAGLGALLAQLAVRALVLLAPPALPRVQEAAVRGGVLAFAVAVSAVAALVAGLLPALHASRVAPSDAARTGGRGGTAGRGMQRVRGALVVAEVALSVVLLAGAGLLVRSYVSLATLDVGFRPERLLTMITLLPEARYPTGRARADFLTAVTRRVRLLPGVDDAAVVNTLPISGLGSNGTVAVEGRPLPPADRRLAVLTRDATPRYHATLGVPLLAGRLLTDADTLGAPRVVVVSRALAATLFPNEDPLGHRLTNLRDSALTIVGVVGDIRDESLEAAPKPTVYMPTAQDAEEVACLVVRTRGEPKALEGAVRRALASVDPEQSVIAVRTMDDYLASAVETRRFSLFLTVVFAGVALALATVGLYGVLAFLVGQRTREIGVRVALGARRGTVVRFVVGGALRLAGAGVAIGAPGALVGARLLRAQLYGVGPGDPVTIVGVAALLLGTAALAALAPARRATRVSPTVALRSE